MGQELFCFVNFFKMFLTNLLDRDIPLKFNSEIMFYVLKRLTKFDFVFLASSKVIMFLNS